MTVVVGIDPRCGTAAGYWVHRRRKEQPCESCIGARRAEKRAQYRAATLLRPSRPDTTSTRFWAKVRGGDVETCWEWTAYRDWQGYGRFSVGGRAGGMENAHRVAWRLLRGEIPEGLQLDHLCFNRACVNPWHLDPVTNEVNSRRSSSAQVNAARQRSVTHCPQGHAYDESNTKVKANGSRSCRACARDYARRKRAGVAA